MASGREKDASLAEEVVISGLEKETTTAVRSTPKRLAVQDPTAALSTCATQSTSRASHVPVEIRGETENGQGVKRKRSATSVTDDNEKTEDDERNKRKRSALSVTEHNRVDNSDGKTEDGERAKRKRSAMSVTEDNGVDNSNGKTEDVERNKEKRSVMSVKDDNGVDNSDGKADDNEGFVRKRSAMSVTEDNGVDKSDENTGGEIEALGVNGIQGNGVMEDNQDQDTDGDRMQQEDAECDELDYLENLDPEVRKAVLDLIENVCQACGIGAPRFLLLPCLHCVCCKQANEVKKCPDPECNKPIMHTYSLMGNQDQDTEGGGMQQEDAECDELDYLENLDPEVRKAVLDLIENVCQACGIGAPRFLLLPCLHCVCCKQANGVKKCPDPECNKPIMHTYSLMC